MKKEEDRSDTFVATREPTIAAQDKFDMMGSSDQPFLNALLSLIKQEMAKLEASIVEKVRAYIRRALAEIVSSRPEGDNSEGDSPLVNFVKGSFAGTWCHLD